MTGSDSDCCDNDCCDNECVQIMVVITIVLTMVDDVITSVEVMVGLIRCRSLNFLGMALMWV